MEKVYVLPYYLGAPVIWDVTPDRQVNIPRSFEGQKCLRLQASRDLANPQVYHHIQPLKHDSNNLQCPCVYSVCNVQILLSERRQILDVFKAVTMKPQRQK
jgi:hypothetical protein